MKSYEYWWSVDESEYKFMQNEFKKAFEHFEQQNYPNDTDTLMCSIHSSFTKKGHNCVACNLEESAMLIVNFLKNYKQFLVAESAFPSFIWFLYLMVERIDEYLNIMELQRGIREKNFKVFSTIRQWTNFIKHPKAFMLVHHPSYIYEGYTIPEKSEIFSQIKAYEIQIDSEFVKDYYSGGDKNKKLFDKLINQEKVIVIFPNPYELIVEFCKAQAFFVELITENKVFRDLLNEKATAYYEKEDSK